MPNWCSNRMYFSGEPAQIAEIKRLASGAVTPLYRRATNEGIQLFLAGSAGLLQITENIRSEQCPGVTAAGRGAVSPENIAFTRWLTHLQNGVPDSFSYSLATRIRRADSYGMTTRCFTDIAGQVKAPTARLKLALESGLIVTALDGLFWLGIQRIAADVQRLRQSGMTIITRDVEVSDSLTGTTRVVSGYSL